jgi:hypothetical protein
VDAVDHGYSDPPYTREIKLGLRRGAGVLQNDSVLAVAGDLARQLVAPFCHGRM